MGGRRNVIAPGRLKTRDEAKDRLNRSAADRLAGRREVPFFPSKSLRAAKRTSSNFLKRGARDGDAAGGEKTR
jgi:hypothetical protein